VRNLTFAGFACLLALSACGGGSLSSLPACPATVELGAMPLKDDAYTAITPLGRLGPPSHTLPTEHHYLVLKPDPGRALAAPVYAMAAGWVVEVSSVEHVGAGYTDYDLKLGLCRDFSIGYGHLSELAEDLRAALGPPSRCNTYSTGGDTYKRCGFDVRVPVVAGQLLGMAGGNPGQYALDLGAKDRRRVQNAFVNHERYEREAADLLYAVSPLAYLKGDLRKAARERTGGWGGARRSAEPPFGTVAYDVPGTAMGNWFREGRPFYPEDPHLALVPDEVDPGIQVISAGASLGALSGYLVRFTPQATGTVNRGFDTIRDESVYCYPTGDPHTSAPAGRVLLRLAGRAGLLAEFQAGKDCSRPRTFAGPKRFNR